MYCNVNHTWYLTMVQKFIFIGVCLSAALLKKEIIKIINISNNCK